MGVPFETLLPYVVCLGMFGAVGAGMSKLRHMQNGVMERDYRLTGYLRGQTDRVKAPSGFELGSRWKVEPSTI